jgi:hypothetical protein
MKEIILKISRDKDGILKHTEDTYDLKFVSHSLYNIASNWHFARVYFGSMKRESLISGFFLE